jgi:hypothetical protein
MISTPLSRRQSLLGAAAGAMLAPIAFVPGRAAAGAQGGPVILTIGGLVDAPNRGPSDPKRDRLFDHNNLNFPKARSFGAGELAALPPHIVEADFYGTRALAKGPRLEDILAVAKPAAAAKTARLFALDGYGAEITLANVQSQSWILAMEADGVAFAIGDFGPLFAVRPLGSNEKKTEEEEAKWVHSLYYIELAP